MRTLLPPGREKEILAEEVKRLGYVPLDRLERDGGWVPLEAVLPAMQRPYDLGVTSMLRIGEKN